jgi:hypothetical protein
MRINSFFKPKRQHFPFLIVRHILKLQFMPKLCGFYAGHGNKTHYRTLSSSFRAPVVGHIPKGMWVTQVIAGGELCVFQPAKI